MKIFLLILCALFFSLFESSLYPIPFLLYICIGCVVIGWNRVFLYCFFSGILLDLIGVRVIGLDSLFFLLSVGFIYLYRYRIHPHTPYYLVPYTVLITLLYGFLHFHFFTLPWFVLSMLSSFIIYLIILTVFSRFISRDALTLA